MSCNGESFIIIPYANIIIRQAILTYIPILLLYMYTINEAAADIVFALIIAFVNFKVPDTVMMSLIIYIVVLALLIVSIVRIHGYRLQCRNIKGDLTDEKI